MLTLAISSCPNDTFIFDPMIHQRVDTEGLKFNVGLHDVQTLNEMAIAGGVDVIKVSFFTYLLLREKYILLDSGSAMGFGNGPLVIAKKQYRPEELAGLRIAVPGPFTTANMLFSIAVPEPVRKEFMIFSSIEDAILDGTVDAGVIIHENRFTYQKKGLVQIMDLGSYWEKLTGSPIPLGGIIARKRLGYNTINKLNRVMFRSVDFALKNPDIPMPFVRLHAAEMEEDVMKQHIRLYVNDNTLSMGTSGKVAITKLEKIAIERGLISTGD